MALAGHPVGQRREQVGHDVRVRPSVKLTAPPRWRSSSGSSSCRATPVARSPATPGCPAELEGQDLDPANARFGQHRLDHVEPREVAGGLVVEAAHQLRQPAAVLGMPEVCELPNGVSRRRISAWARFERPRPPGEPGAAAQTGRPAADRPPGPAVPHESATPVVLGHDGPRGREPGKRRSPRHVLGHASLSRRPGQCPLPHDPGTGSVGGVVAGHGGVPLASRRRSLDLHCSAADLASSPRSMEATGTSCPAASRCAAASSWRSTRPPPPRAGRSMRTELARLPCSFPENGWGSGVGTSDGAGRHHDDVGVDRHHLIALLRRRHTHPARPSRS